MRNKLIAALVIVAVPAAAYAQTPPRASTNGGVGTDNWAECRVASMGLSHGMPNMDHWRVSWHQCFGT